MMITEAGTDVIRLWPDGPPFAIKSISDEVSYVNPEGVAVGTTSLRNISDPSLTVVRPSAKANGHGVVVVPGGGWTVNMWDHEGTAVGGWLGALGFTCFVLKYRVQQSPPDPADFAALAAAMGSVHAGGWKKAQLPNAIADVISTDEYVQARDAAADDGRRAIAIVREQASQWGINPATVGMIGFSAGAFLAVDVALDPQADQLAWIAPIYGGETRGAPVPDDAPPLFTAVAQDDVLCTIVEGLHADWAAADRSSELHVFSRGQHGFGLVKQGMPSDNWTDLFEAWLTDVQR